MHRIRGIRLGAVVLGLMLAGSACSDSGEQGGTPLLGDDNVSIVAGETSSTLASAGSDGTVDPGSPTLEVGQESTTSTLTPDGSTSSTAEAGSATTDSATPDGSVTSAGSATSETATTLASDAASGSAATSGTATTSGSGATADGEPTATTAKPIATAKPTTTTARTAPTIPTTPTTARPSGSPVGALHVSPTGSSSGDGSQAKPFGSIDAAFRALSAGDTLIVHGGEYRERVRLWSGLARGTSAKPITVQAASGERPVIKGILRIRGLHHWTIDGVNVTWDSERNTANEHMVALVDGSNWTYRNSEVWGARSYAGVVVDGDPVNWTLRGLYIHDTYPSNATNQDHLIYCNCGSGGGLIERNLLVGSQNGRAIKVGTVGAADTDVSNLTIRYNTMVDNRGPSNIQLSFRTSNVLIERNVMVGVKDGSQNITAYQLSGSGNVARNNVGWSSVAVLDTDPGLSDGGGNTHADPGLDTNYRPTNGYSSYGHRAG